MTDLGNPQTAPTICPFPIGTEPHLVLYGKTFIETPDFKKLIKMLYVDDILETKIWKDAWGGAIASENERKQIQDYLKLALVVRKHSDRLEDKEYLKMLYHHTQKYLKPEIKVKYYFGKGLADIGRVYPEKSLSLCSIRKEVRHQLCRDIYVDVDMVNCHFELANQLFKDCPTISDYVLNRTKYFDLICEKFTMGGFKLIDWRTDSGYEMCKGLMIRELYYGKWESWCNDNGLPPMDKPNWLLTLEREFHKIADIIKTSNPLIWARLENDNDRDNKDGTLVSWYLQEYERRILEKLVEFFKKKKQIVKGNSVLCFDGLQLLFKDGANYPILLKEAEVFIAKEMKLIIHLKLKEFDNRKYSDRLKEIDIPFVDDEADTFTICDDDENATTVLMERMGENLKYSKGQIFFKYDNIWSSNHILTEKLLIDYIQQSKIYKLNDKGQTVSYAQNYSNAKNIYKSIIGRVCSQSDDGFYKKLHNSSIGMLCFDDGVLNLMTKKFNRWDSDHFKIKENEVFSCVKIERNFEKWFLNPDKKIMKDVESKVFDATLRDQKTRFLQFISRAFAGHYIDKDWAVFLGNRNCGKGTIDTFMKTAFGEYTTTIPSDNLLCERGGKSGDVAKAMSWAIDLQWIRLATTQEIQFETDNKNIKINSIMVKKLASGGDTLEGRKNYQDEMKFTIEAKLLLMCNDMPPVSAEDVKEHLVDFKSTHQFKDTNWIANRKTELEELVKLGADEQVLLELDSYLVGSDDIKTECMENEDWANAFVSILMANYTAKKLVIETPSDSNGTSLTSILLQKFKIGGSNFITNKQLKDVYYPQSQVLDSYKKFRNQLLSFKGVKEHKDGNGNRGIQGLEYTYVEPVIEETQ